MTSYGLARRQRHHVLIAGDIGGHDIIDRRFGELGEFGLGQERHRPNAVRKGFSLFGVVERTVLAENMRPCAFASSMTCRRPDDAAAGIVAAEDRHDHAVVGADVLEATENAGRDVEDVALFQRHLARIAVASPEKTPAALEDEKHLGRAVRVQRVSAFRRLAGSTDVEARRLLDVHMLVRAFRDAGADDGEILFLIGAWVCARR